MKKSLITLLVAATTSLSAFAWPDKPITLVVPFPPGGSTDLIARTLSGKMGEKLGGATVVVENKAGATGTIGATYIARAPADGHTLLYADVAHGINPAVYSKARYDPVKSFVPITRVGASPLLSRTGISMVRLVSTRLAPSSVRKVASLIGVRPPRKLAGAPSATITSAFFHGVSPARAKRIEPPVTTTILQASETSGSRR